MESPFPCTKTAKWLRTELAACFPGVRFALIPVATDLTVTIRWTDGPTEAQIEQITHTLLDGRTLNLTVRGHTSTGTSGVTAFTLNHTVTKAPTDESQGAPAHTPSPTPSWIQRSRQAATKLRALRPSKRLQKV